MVRDVQKKNEIRKLKGENSVGKENVRIQRINCNNKEKEGKKYIIQTARKMQKFQMLNF